MESSLLDFFFSSQSDVAQAKKPMARASRCFYCRRHNAHRVYFTAVRSPSLHACAGRMDSQGQGNCIKNPHFVLCRTLEGGHLSPDKPKPSNDSRVFFTALCLSPPALPFALLRPYIRKSGFRRSRRLKTQSLPLFAPTIP